MYFPLFASVERIKSVVLVKVFPYVSLASHVVSAENPYSNVTVSGFVSVTLILRVSD